MTFIWLCIWLIADTPDLVLQPDPNAWLVIGMVAAACDLAT